MIARPSGVLNRHKLDNDPIHITHTHKMHGVKPITAERSPIARPAELHKVKHAQFQRTSGSVLNVDWLRTSSDTEKLSN